MTTTGYSVFLIVTVFVALEIGLRVFFVIQTGHRAFLYGTEGYRNHVIQQKQKARDNWYRKRDITVELHKNDLEGYSKFFPNEVKVDKNPDTGETFTVTMNSRGFRGREFADSKGDAIRILTLGSSSTFDYYNKDETTYPYLLEEMLNTRCTQGKRFEVINFAIPHSTSAMIASLFLAEGLPLEPDYITIYSGSNDSQIQKPGPEESFVHWAYKWLLERLLLVKYLDYLVQYRSSAAINEFDDAYARERSAVFLRNLETISQAARSNGIQLIVANQQRKSTMVERSQMKGINYKTEVEMVRDKLNATGVLTAREASFLIHNVMMVDLESRVMQRGIPFVDIIRLLDNDRDRLLSWVHLDPMANREIARAFSGVILEEACSADNMDAGDSDMQVQLPSSWRQTSPGGVYPD